MKSSEFARKYGFSDYDVNRFIKAYATFPIKENIWGDIIIPDYIDVESLFHEMLKEKDEKKQIIAEEKLRQEREEQERFQKEQLEFQKEYDRQEKFRQEREEFERRKREEQYHLRIDRLKNNNLDGYYEYKVISLSDENGLFKRNSGSVDTEAMTQTLNYLGLDGWRLVTAYSNELGKNALSGGAGGALLGVNSTVDENILIFERFVKI